MVDDFYWEPSASVAVPTLSFSNSVLTVNENVGTVSVDVNLTNFDINPVSVDVALTGGTATNGLDFVFTPVTLTFPGGANSTQTAVVTIIDDVDFETTENLILSLQNPTNGAVIGTNASVNISISDNDAPFTAPCSDLFISEYIEGSGNNKAIEIYNPTIAPIDLSNYSIKIYANGGSTASSTIPLIGTLNPGQLYIIANNQASQTILSKANSITGSLNFTGNDAVELVNTVTTETIDLIGEIGINPGTSWIVGTGNTQNHTLIRNASIDAGTMIWSGVSNTQWDVATLDDLSNLGWHQNTGCGASIPITVSINNPGTGICAPDTVTFEASYYGGVAPYVLEWNIDGTPTVTTDNSITKIYNVAGTSSISFTVSDATAVISFANITFEAFETPTAGFTIDYTICDQTATIASTAIGNNITYSYGTSTNLILVNQDANTGAAEVSGTNGNYTISQTVMTANGCMDTLTQQISITVGEETNFTLPASICQGKTVPLTAASSSGVWSGNGVTDNGDGTGLFSANSIGTNSISYSTIGICGNASTLPIVVLETPIANFTFTGTSTVLFTNTSTNSTSPTYNWNFGDGNQQTTANPTHQYQNDGVYTVCLEILNLNGCADEICKTVTVIGVGIKENNAFGFEVYPNPTNGIVTINTPENSTFRITNIIGKEVYKNVRSNSSNEIDLSAMPKGAYFITLNSEGIITTKKLIIK